MVCIYRVAVHLYSEYRKGLRGPRVEGQHSVGVVIYPHHLGLYRIQLQEGVQSKGL